MAYDGVMTGFVAKELREKILHGKVEKVYQPQGDELVFHIHSKSGKFKLLAAVAPDHCRLHLIESSPVNPPAPLGFCMLMRKHVQGGRITAVEQVGSERIIEICFETLNEMGFATSKKLIFEIMGRHSNIVLVDDSTGKIIDSIKRISFDVNRVRQILPGLAYQYPPLQDKIPFMEVSKEAVEKIRCAEGDVLQHSKLFLQHIGGISPAFAVELADTKSPYELLSSLKKILVEAQDGASCGVSCKHDVTDDRAVVNVTPVVYLDDSDAPKEFYVVPLREFEQTCQTKQFGSVSSALEFYFDLKSSSNQGKQKSSELYKTVSAHLNKLLLKKKRLSEDLLAAENSEELRLFGELLTANIHLAKPGAKSVQVTNYYDGSTVSIPLDEKLSAAKNAQQYYKRFGKAKTAIKEKQIQLEENQKEIDYLESVLTFIASCDSVAEIDTIRQELVNSGYLKARRSRGGFKEKAAKPQPITYTMKNGMRLLVGRNNIENDHLTFKLAGKTDLWFHTKDIHGSHAVLFLAGGEADADTIYEAAAVAAYHSQARDSENVPVDYVPIRHVKKPSGAKLGMVIFTNNRTVWVNPALPQITEGISV